MNISTKKRGYLIGLNVPCSNIRHSMDKDFISFLKKFNELEASYDEFDIYPSSKDDGMCLIEIYCKCVESDLPIPKWLQKHFYNSFEVFKSEGKLEKSLGLINPARRPVKDDSERNEAIFFDVQERRNNGLTLELAALEASEIFHLHESNIQKIYSVVKKIKDFEYPF
jgi:hypothetical protein